MSRNSAVRYVAIPLRADGSEMLGTHGTVEVNGRRVGVAVLSGEYVSAANMCRFTLSRYGVKGATYAVYRAAGSWSAGGWRLERTYTVR